MRTLPAPLGDACRSAATPPPRLMSALVDPISPAAREPLNLTVKSSSIYAEQPGRLAEVAATEPQRRIDVPLLPRAQNSLELKSAARQVLDGLFVQLRLGVEFRLELG